MLEPETARTVDARNLQCPEPVMLLHKAVRESGSGEVIKVLATDPSTRRDIPAFCEFLQHVLLHSEEQEGILIFFVQKK